MSEYLIISTNTDLMRVASENLVFISSDGNYSTLMFTSGETRVLTFQLGQLEHQLEKQLTNTKGLFIRLGKSLIVNRTFISYINIPKQQLVLANGQTTSHTLSASREVLRNLKILIEKELA